MRALRLMAPLALLAASGCGGGGGVPASALELPHGVTIIWTREEPPEGAGASPQRQFGLGGSGSERDVLQEIARHLKSRGWAPRSCVTPVEECFARGRYFVAMAAASDAPEGYPPRHGTRDQVLAVLEPDGG